MIFLRNTRGQTLCSGHNPSWGTLDITLFVRLTVGQGGPPTLRAKGPVDTLLGSLACPKTNGKDSKSESTLTSYISQE